MRRLSLLIAAVVGLTSGVYTVVYLCRWGWNRAAIAGSFFLATEVLFATALVLHRLQRLERRLDQLTVDRRPDTGYEHSPSGVELAVRGARPDEPHHFAWLRDAASSSNVFLPVLLGLGAFASALGWAIDHLARATTTPTLERRLVQRLAPITIPDHGLLSPPPPVVHAARRPHIGRWLGAAAAIAAAAAGSAAALDTLADQIQTRPDVIDDDTITVLDLRLRGDAAVADPFRTFDHLWAVCTGPGVFSDRLVEPSFVRDLGGGTIQVLVPESIGRHGLDRLTGCIEDTTLDRVQAHVVAVRSAEPGDR